MGHRFDPVRVVDHGIWWPGVFQWLFTFMLLALLVALAVWLVTSARRGSVPAGAHAAVLPPPTPAQDSALLEARMRYARGEISREDFLQISEDLSGLRPPAAPQ